MTGALQFYRDPSVTNTVESVLSTTDSSDVTIRAFNIINPNPYSVYLKFYNITSGSVTVGTSTVTGIITIPGGYPGGVYENLSIHMKDADGNVTDGGGRYLNFNTAISIACTKKLEDNDNTPPAIGIYVELQYQKL